MIKDNYVYKGMTFKRVSKNYAFNVLNKNPDLKFFLVGSNVNHSHFHSGWVCASPVFCKKDIIEELFFSENPIEAIYYNFNYYLEPELGRYPVFYVQI